LCGQLHKISLNDALHSELHKSFLDGNELKILQDQNSDFSVDQAEINFGKEHFYYFKNKNNRRGEIVVLLENTKKHILLHTKPHYPNGVYRLLSGGIGRDESVEDGLEREVYEETGFKFNNFKFIGIVLFKLYFNNLSIPFISYLFKIGGLDREPVIQDKTENISGFKWIAHQDLMNIYHQLINVPEEWKDWGLLRAIPHQIFLKNTSKI